MEKYIKKKNSPISDYSWNSLGYIYEDIDKVDEYGYKQYVIHYLPHHNLFKKFITQSFNEYRDSINIGLHDQQKFIKYYMRPNSLNRGIYVFHGLGSGKTLAAISSIVDYIDAGYIICILLPAAIKHQWTTDFGKYSTIRKKPINTTNINYISYNSPVFVKKFNEFLDKSHGNKLIVVDEAHALMSRLSNPGTKSYAIYDILLNLKNARFIFLSATPIVNRPYELITAFNILKGKMIDPNDKKEYTLFPDDYIEFDRDVNYDVIKTRITGLVSYFKPTGANTHPTIHKKLICCPFGEFQYAIYEVYRSAEEQEIAKRKNFFRFNKSKDEETSTYRIKTRYACNMVLPKEVESYKSYISSSLTKSESKQTYFYKLKPNILNQLKDTNTFRIFLKIFNLESIFTQFSIFDGFMDTILNFLGEHEGRTIEAEINDVIIQLKDSDEYDETREPNARAYIDKDEEYNIYSKLKQQKILPYIYKLCTLFYFDILKESDPSIIENLSTTSEYSEINKVFYFIDNIFNTELTELIELKQELLSIFLSKIDLPKTNELQIELLGKKLISLNDYPEYDNEGEDENEREQKLIARLNNKEQVSNYFNEYIKYTSDIDNILKETGEHKDKYKSQEIVEGLTLDNMSKYSGKLSTLIRIIQTGEGNNGVILIYSFFTSTIIKIIGFLLNKNGYYNRKTVSDLDNPLYKFKSYCVFTGETPQDTRKSYIDLINSPQNMHGELCKILIISSAGSEGISINYIRQIHILEPYWTRLRIDQVIGRGNRQNSHINLPPDERNIHVYEYITQRKGIETTDEYIYKYSHKKKNKNSMYIDICKQYSIDCTLYERDSDLICDPITNIDKLLFYPKITSLDKQVHNKDAYILNNYALYLIENVFIDGNLQQFLNMDEDNYISKNLHNIYIMLYKRTNIQLVSFATTKKNISCIPLFKIYLSSDINEYTLQKKIDAHNLSLFAFIITDTISNVDANINITAIITPFNDSDTFEKFKTKAMDIIFNKFDNELNEGLIHKTSLSEIETEYYTTIENEINKFNKEDKIACDV